MRNLKKILSLALALVMVMSLLTVAGAKDFNDADQIEHTEAVEVMSALGVISGMGNNTFDPKGNVTRAQMAKMITYICLGNVEPTAFLGTTTNLTDINGHWAEAYIKYCYSQGIIAGRGNGIFAPDANVTATEAARMLLVAIGYNADVQVYTGSQWSINVTRDAQISKLYDDVSVTSTEVLNRDKAAQMMYNALTTKTITKTSSVDRVTGDITDIYADNGPTLLSKSYDAQIWVGEFTGNHDFNGSGTLAGEIKVNGRIEGATDDKGNLVGKKEASFPSDFDIKYIGEEVKVIFKDGTTGSKNRPDKYDTIYGVYTTGGTTVYNITRADLQDAKDDAKPYNASTNPNPKIKFGDVKYETVLTTDSNGNVTGETGVTVYVNYTGSGTNYFASEINKSNDVNAISKTNGLRGQSVDTIKFVANDDGKIERAYVTEYNIGRVAAVTSDKITIEGIGSINIADNDIYSGAAVNDVVVYTRYYNSTDRNEAFFTVALAETVEGALTGFKSTDNVVVDGTTYKLNRKTLKDVTDDEILAVASNDIGTAVRAYLVNGMVAAIQKTEEKGGKFALVLEKAGNNIGATVGGVEVNLLLADGTEQTAYIHKDSTSNGTTKLSSIKIGDLIEYSSISDGKVKVYKVASDAAVVDAPVGGKIWNKDTKALTYADNTTAVAASNATLFVLIDANGNGTIDATEKTYAYGLRDLGNIALAQYNGHDQKIAYFLNDDGLVSAAFLVTGSRPGSGTANTQYGIVTGYTGSFRDSDDTDFQYFNVAVNGGAVKEVKIEAVSEAAAIIKKGDLVTFDETTSGEYAPTDFDVLVTGDDTVITNPDNGKNGWVLGAVANTYNSSDNLLTYFTETWKNTTSNLYEGKGTAASATTDKDVKIIYVNGKDTKAGDEVGVGKFGTEKGYANILLHLDEDGVVDVMIVESTGEANLATLGQLKDGVPQHDKKEVATAKFGTGIKTSGPVTPPEDLPEVELPDAQKDIAANAGAGTVGYTLSAGAPTAANGGTVTFTLTPKTAVTNANGDKVTIKYTVTDAARVEPEVLTKVVTVPNGSTAAVPVTITGVAGKVVTIVGVETAAAEAPSVAVTGFDIDKNTVELTAAEATADITVSNIKPDNATAKTVTATSADTSKVTATVSGTKVTVKAVAGLTSSANGTVKVTIAIGDVTKEVTVTINIAAGGSDVAVTGFDIDKNTVELTAAEATADITVSNIKPDNATTKTVTATSADTSKVTATVSGTKVTVKAVAGLTSSANGTVKVTIAIGDVTKEVTVTINIAAGGSDVAVTGFDIDKNTVELTAAEATADITVSNIKPDNATTKTVTATSADTSKVTATVSGTKVTVKAVAGLTSSANGTVKVTIAIGDVTKEVTVTINIA